LYRKVSRADAVTRRLTKETIAFRHKDANVLIQFPSLRLSKIPLQSWSPPVAAPSLHCARRWSCMASYSTELEHKLLFDDSYKTERDYSNDEKRGRPWLHTQIISMNQILL
jgi:hypothetical protein